MYPPITDLIQRYPDLAVCADDVALAFDALKATFERGGKLLVCGNGGSAADSEHIVAELMKGFRLPRALSAAERAQLRAAVPEHAGYLADHLQGALPAVALVSHSGLVTAFANDVAADMIFAQQVFGLGRPGDALLAISTSGNSANVLHALRVARAKNLRTIGLTGRTGGAMRDWCDVTIYVPATDTAAIQERHLPIYHTLCTLLEDAFFG